MESKFTLKKWYVSPCVWRFYSIFVWCTGYLGVILLRKCKKIHSDIFIWSVPSTIRGLSLFIGQIQKDSSLWGSSSKKNFFGGILITSSKVLFTIGNRKEGDHFLEVKKTQGFNENYIPKNFIKLQKWDSSIFVTRW